MLITILTEAGSKQGFGHLTRCCALYYESISLGYETCLIVNTTEPLPKMSRNITVANWLDSSVLMQFISESDYVIVDSYLASLHIYETIAANCKTALYIDDYMRLDYPKGIVINPSLYGDKMPYKEKNGVRYLGGAEYVIVRSEFQNISNITRNNTRGNIMVTIGGTDILNLTPTILKALSNELPLIKKQVVVGQGFGNLQEIESVADENTILHNSLTASQMRDLMLNVDVAITAAGQTIHELLSCGTPMIPIKVVDNQTWNIKGLQELGFDCLDSMAEDLDSVNWRKLIENAVMYELMTFNGQREIIKALMGGYTYENLVFDK